jgi:hypothetical protein
MFLNDLVFRNIKSKLLISSYVAEIVITNLLKIFFELFLFLCLAMTLLLSMPSFMSSSSFELE